jgi:2',3'-cyclic-nucleotide 2'-phosphodiesterase
MRVVFLGDVVGELGRLCVKAALAHLRETVQPDLVVLNGENAAGGAGLTPRLAVELMRSKVDAITLGDHAFDQFEVVTLLKDEPRVIRPFNYPPTCPGNGWVIVQGNGLKLGVVNAMGRTHMKPLVENPFLGIDAVLEEVRKETPCILVDFHAETTSEKTAFGRHLDGRASVVVGTHTHVQTADGRILPGGTAYLTDAGFCGAHDSVIGREVAAVVEKFRTEMPSRLHLAREGLQADGLWVELDMATGRALTMQPFQLRVGLGPDGEPRVEAA